MYCGEEVSGCFVVACSDAAEVIGLGISEPKWMLVFGQNLTLRGWRLWMKKKRFSVEQSVGVVKQAEVGVTVAEVIR